MFGETVYDAWRNRCAKELVSLRSRLYAGSPQMNWIITLVGSQTIIECLIRPERQSGVDVFYFKCRRCLQSSYGELFENVQQQQQQDVGKRSTRVLLNFHHVSSGINHGARNKIHKSIIYKVFWAIKAITGVQYSSVIRWPITHWMMPSELC